MIRFATYDCLCRVSKVLQVLYGDKILIERGYCRPLVEGGSRYLYVTIPLIQSQLSHQFRQLQRTPVDHHAAAMHFPNSTAMACLTGLKHHWPSRTEDIVRRLLSVVDFL